MSEQIIQGTPGQSIQSFAQELIEAWASAAMTSTAKDVAVAGEFNGVRITCDGRSTVDSLVAQYRVTSDANAETWRASPEGQATAQRMNAYREGLQREMDRAMAELPSLPFDNMGAVITWMKRIQEPSDHIHVIKQPRQIVETFQAHGYEIGVNCNEAFDETSADNYGRYLIGQALENLSTVGAIHQVYHKFADEWIERFGVQGGE